MGLGRQLGCRPGALGGRDARTMSRLRAAILLLSLAALGVAPALGQGSLTRPLSVTSASVSQEGQQLVWTVQLGSRFSSAGLRHDHRGLCLVLERARGDAVRGVVCLVPSRRGSGTRLAYSRVTVSGRGRARPLAAEISRTSARELTARFLPGAVGLGYRPMRWQVLSSLRTAGCAVASHTAGCSLWFPGRPRLTRLRAPQPAGCVPAGPSYVTNGSRTERVVALSFDDGPWPDTPRFLDLLEREHVPATFFQIGRQVSPFGRAVDRRILADGDVIGDHTFDHADVARAGQFAARELASTRAAIVRLTGYTPCLFRAPGGAVSPALIVEARALGFLTIGWDVDPRDWSRPGTGSILHTVTGNVRNGSIVIQHDGGGDRSQTLAALPGEIHTLWARGFRFVTVPELLGLRVIYK